MGQLGSLVQQAGLPEQTANQVGLGACLGGAGWEVRLRQPGLTFAGGSRG